MAKVKTVSITKEDEAIDFVYSTTDYDKFKHIGGNRRLNMRNYAKLKASIEEENLDIPIIVNERFEVVDGQHRLEVKRELGLPISYIIKEGYGISQVKRTNMVNANWKKEDFLNLSCEDGIDDYLAFRDLLENYRVNISDLIKLFAIVQEKNQSVLSKKFDEGTFTIEGAEKVAEFLNALEDFSMFADYKSKQFFGAFAKLFFQSMYDHNKMIDRLKTRAKALKKRSTINEYLSMLTKDVYSFGAVKNPIFYDSDTGRFYAL